MSNVLDTAINSIGSGISKGLGWVFGKIGDVAKWLFTEGFKALGVAALTLAKTLSGMDNVFILVGLVGCILIIIGKKELGTKFTSGSILGYIICKGVEAYASC